MAGKDEVGGRVRCEGYYGTVRYTGNVPPSEGEWIGVEWDDQSRGKHDGVHDGVKYFTCSVPGSGSFVRRRKLDFGESFIEVFKKRYNRETVEDVAIGKGTHGKVVEFVGMDNLFDKVSQYESLVHVDLSGTSVCNGGANGDISRMCLNITYLNLNHTLLSSWYEVAKITSQLPLLSSLALSENKLFLTDDISHLSDSFVTITDIVLNKMSLTGQELSRILTLMPNLTRLSSYKNNIKFLNSETVHCVFPNSLEFIDFEDNKISDWTEIMTLKHLPNLKTLLLSNNQLSDIKISQSSEAAERLFPTLNTLSLSNNNLQSWSNVNELLHIEQLEHLKMTDNPFSNDETVFNRRQLLIAKLPHIKLLNSSEVSDKERVQSERYYIRRYLRQWRQSKRDGELIEFNISHPQYEKLIQIHGEPDDGDIENGTKGSALKNSLLTVTIRCSDTSEIVKKKLPDTMTVLMLKALVRRLFKIDVLDQKLSYKSVESGHVIELSDDFKQLSFYSIESYDVIDVYRIES